MKFGKILIAMTTIAMLTACGPSNPSDSNSSSGDITIPDSSNSSSSEIVDEESYTIKIQNDYENITLTADKQKAKQGDLVTITAVCNDPNYKITKVIADTVTCSKVNETTYTFVMPDHPVKVSCEVLVIAGDVTLQGKVTAVFKKEGDLYVARNVKVVNDSEFNFVVKDKDGNSQNMDILKFDRTKTFADIGFVTGSEYNLKIAGNASYDFYYDVNNGDKPCYVKRVNVDVLPNNAHSFNSLFSGAVGGMSAVNPDNLRSATYFNGAAKEKIVWNAYKDNSALATVSEQKIDGSLKEKAVIYAKLDGDKLTYVDSYVPGLNKAHKSNYILSGDTEKFSGLYKISDLNQYGEKTDNNNFRDIRPYINGSIANYLTNSFVYDMQTFEADIMHAYRVGYVLGDGVTQADVNISSTANSDGTFNTKVVSSNTYDSTKDRNSSSTLLIHNEYRVDLTFSKAGALLKATYEEKAYDESDYNFSSNSWLVGDSNHNWENTGKDVNMISISYEYGEENKDSANFDPTPYFVSEIKNLSVLNENAKGDYANKIHVGESVNEFLSFEYAPLTALNARQYKIIDSSNKKVIDTKNGSDYLGVGEGSTDLTLGIVNGYGVTQKVNVNVIAGQKVRNIILYGGRLGEYSSLVENTVSGKLYAGNVNEYGILVYAAIGNKQMPMPLDISAEFVGDDLGIKASFDHQKQTLIMDASQVTVTEPTEVKIKIQTATYDLKSEDNPRGWVDAPIEFTFKVMPGLSASALLGKWIPTDPSLGNASIKFTNEKVKETELGYSEKRPYLGIISCSEGTFRFSYKFDVSKNIISASLLDRENDLSDLRFEFDPVKNELSAIFIIKTWDEDNTPNIEIFGASEGELEYFDIFTKGE